MALYQTLGPVSYIKGDKVIQVNRVGSIIELTTDQAALLSGSVTFWGSGNDYLAPRMAVLFFDTASLFPVEGNRFDLYLDESTGLLSRWDDDTRAYSAVSGGDGDILLFDMSDVDGGTADTEGLATLDGGGPEVSGSTVDLKRMQQRRGLASEWASAAPILSPGEIGVSFNVDGTVAEVKTGDGINPWSALTNIFGGVSLTDDGTGLFVIGIGGGTTLTNDGSGLFLIGA